MSKSALAAQPCGCSVVIRRSSASAWSSAARAEPRSASACSSCRRKSASSRRASASPFLTIGAGIDERGADLARDAEAEIALDARLDDARQRLGALARLVMEARNEHRAAAALRRSPAALPGSRRARGRRAAGGDKRLHGAASASPPTALRIAVGERAQGEIDDRLGQGSSVSPRWDTSVGW